MARKPRHVFLAPQRLLGRNETHPSIVDYTTKSFLALETTVNARGGISVVVPPEDSGLDFLNAEDAASTAVAPALGEGGAAPPGGRGFSFSSEEIVAMMIGHAREFSVAFSGAPIIETVLTVPSYATQNERLSLIDAVELTGLNVLALVDENTAAGIHYGIDRVFENRSHILAIYNMGAEATQVTLFEFNAYTSSAGGKNKTVGQAHVLSKAWDTGLGGRHFDRVIIDYAAAKFNKEKGSKLHASASGDVRNLPLSMAKMRRAVTKAKEILSANEVSGSRGRPRPSDLAGLLRARLTPHDPPRPCNRDRRSTWCPSSRCYPTLTSGFNSRVRSSRRRPVAPASSTASPRCSTRRSRRRGFNLPRLTSWRSSAAASACRSCKRRCARTLQGRDPRPRTQLQLQLRQTCRWACT